MFLSSARHTISTALFTCLAPPSARGRRSSASTACDTSKFWTRASDRIRILGRRCHGLSEPSTKIGRSFASATITAFIQRHNGTLSDRVRAIAGEIEGLFRGPGQQADRAGHVGRMGVPGHAHRRDLPDPAAVEHHASGGRKRDRPRLAGETAAWRKPTVIRRGRRSWSLPGHPHGGRFPATAPMLRDIERRAPIEASTSSAT